MEKRKKVQIIEKQTETEISFFARMTFDEKFAAAKIMTDKLRNTD